MAEAGELTPGASSGGEDDDVNCVSLHVPHFKSDSAVQDDEQTSSIASAPKSPDPDNTLEQSEYFDAEQSLQNQSDGEVSSDGEISGPQSPTEDGPDAFQSMCDDNENPASPDAQSVEDGEETGQCSIISEASDPKVGSPASVGQKGKEGKQNNGSDEGEAEEEDGEFEEEEGEAEDDVVQSRGGDDLYGDLSDGSRSPMHDAHGELDYDEEVDEEHTQKKDISIEEKKEPPEKEKEPKKKKKKKVADESEEEGEVGTTSEEDDSNDEDGELDDDDCEDGEIKESEGRHSFPPGPICKFFQEGRCTWGMDCRFLHPGVNDRGDFDEPYGGDQAPRGQYGYSGRGSNRSWGPNRPQGVHARLGTRDFQNGQPEAGDAVEYPAAPPQSPPAESAWERGLRHAKELRKQASKRKENETNFEEKRKHLSIEEDKECNKENDRSRFAKDPYYDGVYEDDEIIGKQEAWESGQFENFEVRWNREANYPPAPYREKVDRLQEKIREHSSTRSQEKRVDRRVPDKLERFEKYPPPSPKREKEKKEPYNYDKKAPAAKADAWSDPWARAKSPKRKSSKSRSRSRGRRRKRSYSRGSSSSSYSSSSYSSRSRSSSYSSYTSRSSYSRSSSYSSRGSSRGRSRSPPRKSKIKAQKPSAFGNRTQQPSAFGNKPSAFGNKGNNIGNNKPSAFGNKPSAFGNKPSAFGNKPGTILPSRSSSAAGKTGTLTNKPSGVNSSRAGGTNSGKVTSGTNKPSAFLTSSEKKSLSQSTKADDPSRPGGHTKEKRAAKSPEKKKAPGPSAGVRPTARPAVSKEKLPAIGRKKDAPTASGRKRKVSSSDSSRSRSRSSSSRSHSLSSVSSRSSSSGSADSDDLYRDLGHKTATKKDPVKDNKKALPPKKTPVPPSRGRPDNRARPDDHSKPPSGRDKDRVKSIPATADLGSAKANKDPLKMQGQKSNIKLTLINKQDRSMKRPGPTDTSGQPPSKRPAPSSSHTEEKTSSAKSTSRDKSSTNSKPSTAKAKATAPPAAAPQTSSAPKKPDKADKPEVKSPTKAPAVAKPKKSTSSRREELLKQLKAVEDAIARKRAKMQ